MNDLFIYLFRSGACLALFYAFYWLILKRETCFALNRAFLLGSAVLSLALPLVRVPSPFLKTVVYASAFPAETEAAAALPAAHAAARPDLLLLVYAAGAGLFLLSFFIKVGRLALMASRCGCERRRGLRIVVCGHPGESFSFFHFVFLNKAKIPDGDLDRILAHELAHVRQAHSFDVVFAELLTVIQWFNPFVWPYKRSLRETHEYLADRAVIAQGCSLARYQLLIVEQHVGGQLLELASSFRTSQIKRRITMLSKQETKGLARWKPLLILPLAAMLVLAFAEARTVIQGAPAAPAPAAPGPAAPAPPAAVAPPAPPAAPAQEAKPAEDEEMIKALKENWAKLEQMKQKNDQALATLKAKLEEAPDAETKAKIQAKLNEEKILSLQIGAKQRMLQMKKLEYTLNKEQDPARKAELNQKLEQLKVESDQYQKKLEELNAKQQKAEEKDKPAPEKH